MSADTYLLALLKEALEMMEEHVNNQDGRDRLDLGCGNCEAGVPINHSLGCRMRSAIRKAEAK